MQNVSELRMCLREGRASIGSWLQIPSPDTAEIMARSGYDWLAVDMEHGAMAASDLPSLFRAIVCGGALPMVRLGHADKVSIQSALDIGAQGLIFPMIESAAQLHTALRYALYPRHGAVPNGIRGMGYCRANNYGKDFELYAGKHAANILLVAQVEHIHAVKDLENIVRVPRLDAIFVGPYDLSASLGVAGEFTHPCFIEAMERIRMVCQKHAMPLGVHVVQPCTATLAERVLEGYTLLAYGTDAVFLWQSSMRPFVV